MSETDQDDVAADGPGDWVRDQFARYRDVRGRIERDTLPLATSVDGSAFEFQASLHGLELKRGAYVVLEHEGGDRFGQITELTSSNDRVDVESAPGVTTSILVRRAVGSGLLLDRGGSFHDALARPARPDEVGVWLDGTRRRDRASLVIGELLLAPGVPAELDSGGFNRHTFMCGQSGSGKTYSLGLLLEKVLAETTLRIVILDPNSDYVGLGRVREGADPARAERHQAIGRDVAVWSNEAGADHALKLRFAELDTRTQGAVLGLDPIADRDEYAVLHDLLRANDRRQVPDHRLRPADRLVDPERPAPGHAGGQPRRPRLARLGTRGPLDPRGAGGAHQPVRGRGPRVPADARGAAPDRRRRAGLAVGLAPQPSARAGRHRRGAQHLPPPPDNTLSRITTERAIQIAAEGRKYGLYVLVSTQRPNKVHENVVSQCDNLLLMRMNSMADVGDLTRLFSFVPPGLMAGAPSFGMGQALVAGRLFPQGSAYVQMGDRVSQEGGADVPTTWASVRTSSWTTSWSSPARCWSSPTTSSSSSRSACCRATASLRPRWRG